MSLEGSRPVERTEKLILGKEKEPLACGGCGVSAERKVLLLCPVKGFRR
jgi:hypothetical protein